MLVGMPYLAIGVRAMVAVWLVMNWLISRAISRGGVNA